jgi:hypothetical protein
MVVLAGAGLLYVLTCAPGVLWQDSGLFVYRIWHNDVQGNLGLALSHPLYIIIGIAVKHIPLGDLAWRMNIVSAVFGAVAVANLFLLLRLWLGTVWPAAIGAVLFRYTRTKRPAYLYLLGLLNGLAIANHMWAVFGFACYAVLLVVLLVRKQIGLRQLALTALLWVIGALPYGYLIIKNIVLSGDVQTTLFSAVFGNMWYERVLNVSISLRIVFENVIFILLNFPTPNFVFFFVGLWTLRKKGPSRSFSNIVLALLILHFLFAFRYTVPDRYVFFLPFYCLAAMLIGLGADVILRRYSHKVLVLIMVAFVLLPIPIYYITPGVARKMYKPLGQRRQRPYRDEYDYFLQPWKTGYKGAERFAKEALDMVEKDAIIYADTTTVHALLYMQQVKDKRSDVRIVSAKDKGENAPVLNEDTVAGLINGSVLYVVSPVPGYCPQFLLERYEFKEVGVLWKVID